MAETRKRLNPRERMELEYGDLAVDVLTRADRMASEFVDDDDILRAVRRFIDNDGRVATELRSLYHDPIAMECLVRLAGCSRFGLGIAIFEYGQFWSVVQDRMFRQIWGRQSMREEWEQYRHNQFSYDGRINALLNFQHRHLLRIILGDLMGDMTLGAITAEIADLADVCIQAALDLASDALAARQGPMPGPFVVFAMGKLGARELNYSSDIDLIFTYQAGGDEAVDSHDYFCRLGQEVIRILDSSFARGRLYRVDMRLRPEGDAGELALAHREVLDYCYSVGRSWERQAWIKARPVAGDLQLGKAMVAELTPWIYPVDPRWEELQDASVMRQRIEERSQDDDVKIGSGGIRDIEFLVQYYQLGWGGRIPELRCRSTLDALDVLERHGLISRDHHQELMQAYEWLRMVEHRLQMWESRQIHELPGDHSQRARVADRCGYHGESGLQQFDQDLHAIRTRVRSLAEEHYLTIDDERMAAFILINREHPSAAACDRLLAPVGFSDQQRALQWIRALAHEPFFLLRRSRTEHALADLLPDLLLDIGHSPDPDRALHNFVRMVESVGGRALFYEQLVRQADTRRRLTNLAGWADALVDTMVAHPGLADEVVERLQRGQPSSQQMSDELRDVMQGASSALPACQFLQARELVAAAIEDLEGMAPWAISRHLSAVAQAVVQALLTFHRQQLAKRWGLPVDEHGAEQRFCVLGLGKSGSAEMSYASDLDILFVCDNQGECPDGEHDGETFWRRVCQAVMRDCQEGRLYELDARLRPWGEQGALVVSLNTVRHYWRQDKQLWERLAHTRLSHFAGDSLLSEAVMAIVAEAALEKPVPADAREQVLHMRQRLEDSVSGQDHVKRGYGGYVDVEFLLQFVVVGGQLSDASAPMLERQAVDGLSAKACELLPPMLADLHALREPLDRWQLGMPIAEVLAHCAKRELLAPQAVADLLVGLTLLRWIESRMRLYAGKAISHLPTDHAERRRFARCAGYPDVLTMDRDLHLVRERCRFWFTHYLQVADSDQQAAG